MTTVGSGPPAVCALDQVGDNDVGVELGIAGPAGAVTERGADEPVGLDELLAAGSAPGVARLGWTGGRARRRPPGHGRRRSRHGRHPVPNAQRSETPLGAENVRS